MESIIKGYLGMFYLVLISFTGVGIIAASCRVRQAERFLSDVVYEIEASEGNEEVIDGLYDMAEDMEFELSVLPGEAVLTYSYSMPLFGFENSGQISSNYEIGDRYE